jgi:acyl-CoA thioester hydrolase
VDGFNFSTGLTVRFAETDAQGIAHHSNYLVWFELARVEYLRAHAGGYQAMRDRGLEAIVTGAELRYRTSARFDDRLTIHARCLDVRGARFRYEYVVERDDGERIADGWTGHAVVDAGTLRPTRVPEWLAEAIERAETPDGERRGLEAQTPRAER